MKFTRQNIAEIAASGKSEAYWAKEAQAVFNRFPSVNTVETVHTGRLTDSEFLRKFQGKGKLGLPSREVAVIIASTGGKWGRSRRNFYPCK